MSRPFNLPFLPRTDSAMTQMPVLRVRVVTEHPENLTKETANALAQRELSRHMPKILNYYQAQQANSRASGLDLSKTHMVNDNIELRHTNLNGTPILEVIVKVDDALSQLCMMVLYSGNKIAALDMKALDAGKLSKVYGATLTQSSWSTELTKTMQYRFSKTETVVYCPLSFSRVTIVSEDTLHISRTIDKDVARSLTQSVASRSPRVIAPYFYTPDYKVIFDPIITGTGSTFYTQYDVYEITSDSITWVGDNASVDDIVYSIEPDGTCYYGVGSHTGFFSHPIAPRYDPYNNGEFAPVGISQTVADAAIPLWPTYVLVSEDYIGYYKGAETIVEVAYMDDVWTLAIGPYSVYADPNMGSLIPNYTYQAIGGIDRIDISAGRLEIAMSGAHSNTDGSGLVRTVTFGGATSVQRDETSDYSVDQFIIPAWPPAYNGKPYFGVKEVRRPFTHDYSGPLYTPYGVFELLPAGEGDGLLDGRLHASNGKHVLQGFNAKDGAHLYLDGNDIGSRLAGLLGCTVDDIQSILLDIPLARIKQFR